MGVTADLLTRIHPLHVTDYEQMVDAGILGPEDKVELIDGVILEMSPQGLPHSAAMQRLTTDLIHGLPRDVAGVRCQLPLRLPPRSMPEPDLAVVAPGDYDDAQPETAWLVIEVADSSKRFDLATKAALYARHAVPEYWVLDVRARGVHVHTSPSLDGYAHIDFLAGGTLTAHFTGAPALDLDALLALLPR